MKQWSTTPVSVKKFSRPIIGALVLLMAVAVPSQFFSQNASADRYDDQIRAIEQQIDEYNNKAKSLSEKGDSLQLKLNEISNEKNKLQAEINLNQAKHDKLKKEIDDNKKAIQSNRDALGTTLADMYVEGKISPLEMLASSSTIGDYLDKQERLSSVRDTLKSTIDDIKKIQAELEKQQKAVELVLANQANSKKALQDKENEQARLVSETRGEEAAYKKLIGESKAERERVMQAQQAAIAAASANNGGVQFVGGGANGYPWGEGNCPMMGMFSTGGADGNGGDGWGYGCRQCASYAAWKIGQRTGVIPTRLGNANNFPGSLSHVPQGYTARANSVGVISSGVYGHVVWVESDPDAAGFITVSQYNANYGGGWGNFSRVRVHQSTYDTYIYF